MNEEKKESLEEYLIRLGHSLQWKDGEDSHGSGFYCPNCNNLWCYYCYEGYRDDIKDCEFLTKEYEERILKEAKRIEDKRRNDD